VLTKLTFFFNSDGKCDKYQVDIDFLAAFGTIVSDPHDLDLLFARALIADNCMFGLIESPDENASALVGDGESLIGPASLVPGTHDYFDPSSLLGRDVDYCAADDVVTLLGDDVVVGDRRGDNGSSSANAKDIHAQQVACAHQVVRAYYFVFSPGSAAADGYSARTAEDRFVASCCESGVCFDNEGGLQDRWLDLRECFDTIDFRLVHEESACYDACLGAYRVDTVGVYKLGITPPTIELVFPHVSDHPTLVAALVYQTIRVESLVTFWISEDTGKLQRVREHMDLSTAIAALVPHPADLAFVLRRAFISVDGILRVKPR
jgi:hypothetical protein